MKKLLQLVAVMALTVSLTAGTTSSSSRSSSSSSGSRSSSSSGWGGSSRSSGSSSGWGGSSSSSKPSSSGWGSSSSSSKPSSSGWGGGGSTATTPSKPSSSGWGGSTATTPSKPSSSSGWGGSGGSANSTKPTASSSSAVNKMNQSVATTPMKSKSDYVADFKKANEAKYVNKFSAEPAARPSYIPSTTTLSTGVSVPLVFNANFGGYGYYSGAVWTPYDPLAMAAANAFNTYAATAHYQQPIVYHDSTGLGTALFVLVAALVVFAIIGAIVSNRA